MVGRQPQRGPGSEKLLYPAVGIVVGVLAFAMLFFFWPAGVKALAADRRATLPGTQSDPQRSGATPVGDVKVVPGGGVVAVSWTERTDLRPASYQAVAVPEDEKLDQQSCTTSELSCVIGLVNGATYTVEERSESADGALSAPQRVTATPRPDILAPESTVAPFPNGATSPTEARS